MRTIRNQKISTASHQEVFDQGSARILRDKAVNPTNYRDYELDAIARKERVSGSTGSRCLFGRGYLFGDLLQVLSWEPRSNQVQG